MEPKITVVAKDGQANVKIGADMIILQDRTESTFHTKIIGEFISYINNITNDREKPIVYANGKRIEAYIGCVNYNIHPISICDLEYHPKLLLLCTNIKRQTPVYVKEMEQFLENLKDCLDGAGRELLKYLKDFKQSIVLDVERQKDNKGNFTNSIKRSVRGKEEKADYVFPDKITFTVPMFNYDEHRITIEVETRFDFDLGANDVKMYWNLVNFDLDTILDELAKAYIMAKLDMVENKHWGLLNIIQQTNEWSYKQNQLDYTD